MIKMWEAIERDGTMLQSGQGRPLQGESIWTDEWKWGSKPLEDLTQEYSQKREQQTPMS